MKKPKRRKFIRPQVGTHIDRNPRLNPNKPAAQEPGEKRGTGKGAIKLEIQNTIWYRLSNHGRVLVHHEECLKTLKGAMAEKFIREWLGLNDDDYCTVLKTAHTFVPDIPKLKVEPEDFIRKPQHHSHA